MTQNFSSKSDRKLVSNPIICFAQSDFEFIKTAEVSVYGKIALSVQK